MTSIFAIFMVTFNKLLIPKKKKIPQTKENRKQIKKQNKNIPKTEVVS